MALTRAECQARDNADPLAPFRARFVLPTTIGATRIWECANVNAALKMAREDFHV